MKIPLLGFGTWQLQGSEAESAVKKALEIGFRHIDTADRYNNHKEVGQALQDSGVPRSEIFLTTKVWHSDLRSKDLHKAVNRFLKELQTDYLDLLLIHWPNSSIPLEETLAAMGQLKKDGVIKNIGVSNFTISHLKDALDQGVDILTNQVEFHPSLNQKALKEFCDKHKILITAYSPIAQGQDLQLPLIVDLAEKYQRSEAQVILNWLISKNIVAIPRTTKPERIEDIYRTLEWKMDAADVKAIDNLHTNNRMVIPPFAEFERD